jgi:hypothetical protein
VFSSRARDCNCFVEPERFRHADRTERHAVPSSADPKRDVPAWVSLRTLNAPLITLLWLRVSCNAASGADITQGWEGAVVTSKGECKDTGPWKTRKNQERDTPVIVMSHTTVRTL